MRLAVVLYGQPRNYLLGYDTLQQFLTKDMDVSFYFHCWILTEGEQYEASPWRNIHTKDLMYTETTMKSLIELYRPMEYEFEQGISMDTTLYNSTLAYTKTSPDFIRNMSNILSQLYSRNKAKNLLKKQKETYDFVLMTRFDNSIIPCIERFDANTVYVPNTHFPRKIFDDNLIISPYPIFIHWFDYDNLHELFNNDEIENQMISFGENMRINIEETIFMLYLFYYKDLSNVHYFSYIKNTSSNH